MKVKGNVLIIIITILTIISFYNNPISSAIYNYYIYIYITFVFIALIFKLITKNFKLSKNELIIVTILFIHIILAMFLNNNTNGGFVTIIGTIILIYFFKDITYTKLTYKILLISFLLLGLYLTYISKNVITDRIIYINPNLIGQLLLLSTVIINTLKTKLNIKEIHIIIINFIFIYGIFTCQSRASLVVTIIYLIIIYIPILRNILRNKKARKICYITIILITLAIPYIYVYLYNNNITLQIFSFSDKNFFSGRQQIWIYLINHFKNFGDLFWGIGTNTNMLEVAKNANPHNVILFLIMNTGIVGMVMYLLYIYNIIFTIKEENYCTENVIGILALLLCGAFETIIVFAPINVFMCILIGMNFTKKSNKEEKQEQYIKKY